MTEEEWLAETAKECRCCPDCTILPCPGCQQGSVCDETCRCSRLEESYDDGDEE